MSDVRKKCPVEMILQIVGNKWTILLLKELFSGVRRFGELRNALEGISTKMLTQQLRKLEKDGMISRKVYAEVPPKVEYFLTEKGRSFEDVLETMRLWGEKHAG